MLNGKVNGNVYVNAKQYGNVLSCINIYLYVYEICMHMLRYYEI